MKSRTSLFVIGILIAMLAASLLTVLVLFLTGTLAPNKPLLEFGVKQIAAKEYDGTPLTAKNGEPIKADDEENEEEDEKEERFYWESGWDNLKEGHRVEGRFYGSQTDVGISDSDLRVKVYDERDRDVTSEYSIKVHNCELRVLPKAITVVLEPQQIQYSGKEIPIESYTIYRGILMMITSDSEKTELVPGQRLIISFPGFENVGDKLPAVTEWRAENFKICNVTGNDVSDNYALAYGMRGVGTIEIVPRRIKVKALDAEKLYDGTPIDGSGKYEVIGSLAEGEYIGGVQFEDEDGNGLPAFVGEYRVKVTDISFYKQDGFNIVPAENYIWESDDDDVYGTFTVKPRPVTVWAKDIVKLYDGEALSVDNDSFSTDLTLEGCKVEIVKVVGDGIADVYDGTYSIKEVAVKKDGKDLSEQFDIHYEKATARATILPIGIRFRLNSPDPQTYKGEVIGIPLESALAGLEESISEYIEANGLSEKAIAEKLKAVDSASFRQVCSESVKNAGTYYFNAELTENAIADLFDGKTCNVLFEFTDAEFKINKAYLTEIWYSGTNGAENRVEKTYDGREAKELDSGNVRLKGFNNLAVTSVDFRYEHNYNHTTICGIYSVIGNVVQIINTKTSEDVTKNFTTQKPSAGGDETEDEDGTITPFKVAVTINPKRISAIASQAVINADPSTTDINALVDSLRYSIIFSTLAEGDTIGYYYDDDREDDFDVDYYNTASTSISVSVALSHVWNADGVDVIDCYILENADETIITINFTKSA